MENTSTKDKICGIYAFFDEINGANRCSNSEMNFSIPEFLVDSIMLGCVTAGVSLERMVMD
jgi:hypothetical protein